MTFFKNTSALISLTALNLLLNFNLYPQKNINLHIISSEGIPFLLELDGKAMNNSPQANLEIKNLESKEYQSNITFPESGSSFKGKIYTIWEGIATDNREFTYTIDKSGNNQWRIRFLSSTVLEIKKDTTSNKKDSIPYISESDFNKYLSTINFQSFEDSRLHKSEELFLNTYLNLSQIIQVCEVFEYDQSKLSFLKFIYKHSKEKTSFKTLESVFTYRNSKNEFLKWLESLELKNGQDKN